MTGFITNAGALGLQDAVFVAALGTWNWLDNRFKALEWIRRRDKAVI